MNTRQSPKAVSNEVKPHEEFERNVIKLQENLKSLEMETNDLIKDRQLHMIEIKEELHLFRKRASMLTTERGGFEAPQNHE